MRCYLRVGLALAGLATLATACGPTTPTSDGCKAKLLPGDLVITEVFADYKAASGDTGDDTGKEWFEIYNAKDQPIDLTGLTITHSRPDGGRPNTHTVSAGTIAPGQFFTLGNATPERVPAYVDYGYGDDLGDLFNTDGGKLALSCGDDEIDSASYGAIKEGHARELTGAQPPEYTLNDDQANWCQANDTEFEAGNFGTPGADNDCRPIVVGQCNDGGAMRDAVAPGPGDLVITEVMPSPAKASDANGEWFEARVRNDVDLNGVGLDRMGDNNIKPDVITATDCVHVTAGSYVVFARSSVPAMNGGIPAAVIAGTFKFSLIAGSPTVPGDVAILAGTTVVDAVSWTRSTTGKSLQLDPDLVDPSANDTESNFCDATTIYGQGDLGTPGAANTQCAMLPPAGMCDDGGTIRAIVRPRSGQLVISEFLANPANVTGATDAQREWFEIANTSATAFDLNELVIGRIGDAGAPVQSARCISVRAHGFAVFARSADPAVNGMLPSVDATFNFGLVDTNGDIQISQTSEGDTILDAVRWTSVTSGVTRQLDPAHLTTTDNDVATNFCAGTAPYGDQTNKGTPGAANSPCP
jgi:Lamin Tail Domain